MESFDVREAQRVACMKVSIFTILDPKGSASHFCCCVFLVSVISFLLLNLLQKNLYIYIYVLRYVELEYDVRLCLNGIFDCECCLSKWHRKGSWFPITNKGITGSGHHYCLAGNVDTARDWI